MANCKVQQINRRRLFWSTRPSVCGETVLCGVTCSQIGISVEKDSDGNATISTDDWVRGLIMNMLLTDGRKEDTPCGFLPGSRGGHWSENFISGSEQKVGTLMRTIPQNGSVQQLTVTLNAYVKSTLQRLVQRGVAVSVDSSVKYVGSGRFQLEVIVLGRANNQTHVGLSAERLSNGWIWT